MAPAVPLSGLHQTLDFAVCQTILAASADCYSFYRLSSCARGTTNGFLFLSTVTVPASSDSDHEQTLCKCASARRLCRIHSGRLCRHLGISQSDIVAVHARYPIPAICFSVLRRALAASGGRLQWPLISSSL